MAEIPETARAISRMKFSRTLICSDSALGAQNLALLATRWPSVGSTWEELTRQWGGFCHCRGAGDFNLHGWPRTEHPPGHGRSHLYGLVIQMSANTIQCCCNVGPASTTPVQHCSNTGSTYPDYWKVTLHSSSPGHLQ